jgi:hypothetical protein
MLSNVPVADRIKKFLAKCIFARVSARKISECAGRRAVKWRYAALRSKNDAKRLCANRKSLTKAILKNRGKFQQKENENRLPANPAQ